MASVYSCLTLRPGPTVVLELRCHRLLEPIKCDLCFLWVFVAMKIRQAESVCRSNGLSVGQLFKIHVYHLLPGKSENKPNSGW